VTTTTELRRRALPGVTPSAPEKVGDAPRWTREWTYFVLVVAAWCFTPLLRRLIDLHNGAYNPVQITSLIPFVMTIPLLLVALRRERLALLTPAFRVFMWVWIGTFTYGVLIAAANGNLFGAIFAAIQYVVPMIIGIWIAGQPRMDNASITRRLMATILPFGTVVGIYGLAQFVAPPPWDVLWVLGGQFAAMGAPIPFQMRVFSTLNSAGPAADFFTQAILLSMPLLRFGKAWVWPFITVLGAALLLTLVREAWIALLLGVVVYIVFSPRRVVTFPIMLAFAVIFSVLVAFLPAFLGAGQDSDVVSARIATIADVNHDESAIERSQEIQDSIQEALSDPIGSGLGTIGSAAMISSNLSLSHGTVLDSGYLARLVELGWLGFVGYLFVAVGGFATILWSIFSRGSNATQSAENKVLLATAAAMCAALVWADAAGDAHLGVEGVFFWIAMGIGLRSNRIQSISDEGADVKDASLPKFRNLWVAATR
jgi:putative inorganic carbon (HCO3(-)) transporter